MDRRIFMTGAVVGGAALLAACSEQKCPEPVAADQATGASPPLPGAPQAPAILSGKKELKLVTTWPKNFPGLGTGAQRFADRVTAMTGGALTIKLFAAGELVPPFDSFDAVSKGTADMYHGAEYYWQGKSKAFNFFCSVPFGLTANENDAWLIHGGGMAVWDEIAFGFNVKGLPCGNTGVQMGGWFNKEMKRLDDFKGLKMRMPGLGGETLRKLGATAVTLPGGEIFAALQSGAIDATEWVGPWNDLALGFYKATKFYYWPGFHEPGSTLSVGINRKLWDSLTTEQRAIIEAAAFAENNYMLAEFNRHNAAALDTLVKDHKVQLRQFPDEIMKAIGTAAGEVLDEIASSGDAMTKKVLASFLAARKQSKSWTTLSELAYTRARNLDFKYGG